MNKNKIMFVYVCMYVGGYVVVGSGAGGGGSGSGGSGSSRLYQSIHHSLQALQTLHIIVACNTH